jgi:hypothetical protein
MAIPGRLMHQTVAVEPYTGEGAHGPVYGPAAQVGCWIIDKTELVRNRDGREVVSRSRFLCRPGEIVPEESRVTCSGRVTRVIAVHNWATPGPSPHHMTVYLE